MQILNRHHAFTFVGLKNLIKGKHTSGGHYARGALWELFHGHDIVEKTGNIKEHMNERVSM